MASARALRRPDQGEHPRLGAGRGDAPGRRRRDQGSWRTKGARDRKEGECGVVLMCLSLRASSIQRSHRTDPMYANLGLALHDKKRLADAIACYGMALEVVDRRDAHTLNNLGAAKQVQDDTRT